MEDIENIVSQNLIKLRKSQKLTQMELAEKIGYSDKAISRWEKGEVIPDIQTLNKLSELYDIEIGYFFEKHGNEGKHFKIKKVQIGNKMAISLLAIVCVWFIAAVIYAYLLTIAHINIWILYIWAIPSSFVLAIVFNSIWGQRQLTFVYSSLLVWTLLLAFYLQFVKYHVGLIFIIGIPMQIGIALWSCIKPNKKLE